MIPFDYQRPANPADATDAVANRTNAAFLGGGTNLVDHLKLGVTAPDLLVDVTQLPYGSIDPLPDGGIRIGATVKNSELAAAAPVRERYPVLAEALLAGASGQLRNMATTAGNLLQRTRCVYFQDVTTPCNKRDPGSGCAALEGHNRYHAILGASPSCVAVHPSDMAVAMTAIDAVVEVTGRSGERQLQVEELHRLPEDEPHRDTVLEHGDLVTGVSLPPLPMAANSSYRKVRDRASYAFALVSAAAALSVEGGRIDDVRLALGGVAHKPWRAYRAEQVLRGAPATEEWFRTAADAELSAAQPLPGNAFKLPMVRNTIVAVLRDLVGQET